MKEYLHLALHWIAFSHVLTVSYSLQEYKSNASALRINIH